MNVVNNVMRGNSGHGLFLEISDTAVVAGNLIANNGGFGIQVNNTGHVKLWNNTFLGGGNRPVNLVQDDRDAADLTFNGYDQRQPRPDPTVPWKLAGRDGQQQHRDQADRWQLPVVRGGLHQGTLRRHDEHQAQRQPVPTRL